MLPWISRVLAFAVAALVAGALFIAATAIWSWWEPFGSDEPPGPVDPVSAQAGPRSPSLFL